MRDATGGRRPNHLQGQTSPYLLQHVYNPVDWYPWGDEPLERSRVEQKPIFLSVGYAACHWCHVMERVSFEDDGIACFLNEHFVSIKDDREERPDLDEIYMNAVQLMTGAGGWPMTVFLTPDLRPFFGGTYFPPQDSHGRIGFAELLRRVQAAWNERRDEIDRSAEELTARLRHIASGSVEGADGSTAIGPPEWNRAVAELTARYDSRWGGFGEAPKFPADGSIALLLREHHRSGEAVPLEMAERTLQAMANGGIYDHVGGGFARYSVDERWLVPHFEKMLYNQALLVPLYVDAWRITARPLYRRVVEQTLDFVRRELTDDGGGFHSSLDADSEGVEGEFYVWTAGQVIDVLGSEDGRFYCDVYGISEGGNFEGRNIANLLGQSLSERANALGCSEDDLATRLEPARARLLAARGQRVRPGTDDKVLTSWNGLMITAFARAYQALGREGDLAAAQTAAEFTLTRLVEGNRLRVTYREGTARLNAYLDEHAFLARGLLDLYEAGFDVRHLEASARFANTMIERFGNADGGFFFTSDDHEALLTRNLSHHDGALPSGAGVACEVLARLAVHLDDGRARETVQRTLRVYHPMAERMPSAYGALLAAADFERGPVKEVVIAGDRDDPLTAEMLAIVRGRFLPRLAIARCGGGESPGLSALLRDKKPIDGKPTAYVCQNYSCREPTSDPRALERLLDSD
jgi:uncharacterized protein YyaL (SSP411 family)